jgi:hypothetical protein
MPNFDRVLGALKQYMRGAYSEPGEILPRATGILENIRDFTPATLDILHPDKLADAIGRAAREGNGSRMISTTPNQFLSLARPLDTYNGRVQEQIGALSKMLTDRVSMPDAYGKGFYAEDYPDFQGFASIPYLNMIQSGAEDWSRVIGHEGRHRMNAISDVYGPNTPISILAQDPVGNTIDAAVQQQRTLPEGYGGIPFSPSYLKSAPQAWRDGGST